MPNHEVAVGRRPSVARTLAGRRTFGQVDSLLSVASLALILLVSIALAAVAARQPSFLSPVATGRPFPSWMAGPLAGVWPGRLPQERTLQWLVSAALALLLLAYVVVVWEAPRIRARWVITTILALHLLFLLAPPLQYTDVFNYINYGRMGVVHHLNPYTVTPVHEPHNDPAYAYSNWHYLRSPYGPLFTLLTYAIVPLGVALSFWLLKLITAVCSIGLLALVWRGATKLERSPTRAVALVGLNPVVLLWGLGGVHIDFPMMLLVVGASYLLLASRGWGETRSDDLAERRRPLTHEFVAGCMLVGAVGIKASAVVFLPLGVAMARRRVHVLAGMALAAAILAVATLIVFGPDTAGLLQQAGLVSPEGIPNLIGIALGFGGATSALRAVLAGIAAIIVLAAAARAWRRPPGIMRYACVSAFAAILTLGWSPPWYVLWALPFVALVGSIRWRAAAVVYTVYALIASGPNIADIEGFLHFSPRSDQLGRQHIQHFEHLASE
jgi:hypothetical protein